MMEYREKVAELAHRRTGVPIYNSSLEHAAVIVEHLFASANDSVALLTGELNAQVYGREDVVREAKLFLVNLSHKARILIEDASDIALQEHPLLVEFANNANVEVKELPAEFRDIAPFHFMVADHDCYRFEADKNKPEAVAAFGDGAGAKNLNKLFDNLWSAGKTLQLPQGAAS